MFLRTFFIFEGGVLAYFLPLVLAETCPLRPALFYCISRESD